MSSGVGLSVLAVYGIIAFAMTYYFSRGYNDNKVSFLVARRHKLTCGFKNC